jgi:arsenate reductase
MSKKTVLFLCTGNSCRSQMAEGLVNHYLGDVWRAYSAGTAPAGYVHPLAIEAMAELDVDITAQHSKSVETFRNCVYDLVVTVCDDAAENCPIWPGMAQRVHIAFPDPANSEGTEEERLVVFREVRDAIRAKVFEQLREVTNGARRDDSN